MNRRELLGAACAGMMSLALPKMATAGAEIHRNKTLLFAGVRISYGGTEIAVVSSDCNGKGIWTLQCLSHEDPLETFRLHESLSDKKIALAFINSRPDPTASSIMRHALTGMNIPSYTCVFDDAYESPFIKLRDDGVISIHQTVAFDRAYAAGFLAFDIKNMVSRPYRGWPEYRWEIDSQEAYAAALAVSARCAFESGLIK